jgi:hypothetical protein
VQNDLIGAPEPMSIEAVLAAPNGSARVIHSLCCPSAVDRLETRLHPRYGESAVQVSGQCDVLPNESPTFSA